MTRYLCGTIPSADSTPTTVAEVMRGAINRLSGGPEKWAKGDFHVDGGACALGAIADAMSGKAVNALAYRQAEALLLKNLKDSHPELVATTIPELNDDPAVTYEDVLNAFEKTAVMLEEKGL